MCMGNAFYYGKCYSIDISTYVGCLQVCRMSEYVHGKCILLREMLLYRHICLVNMKGGVSSSCSSTFYFEYILLFQKISIILHPTYLPVCRDTTLSLTPYISANQICLQSSISHSKMSAPQASQRRAFDPYNTLQFDLYHELRTKCYFGCVPEQPQVLAARSFLVAGFDTRFVPRRFQCDQNVQKSAHVHTGLFSQYLGLFSEFIGLFSQYVWLSEEIVKWTTSQMYLL